MIFLKRQCIVSRIAMIHFQLSKILERIPVKIHLYLLIFSIIITAFAAICTKFTAESAPSTTFFGVNTILLIYLIILGAMGLQVIFWQQSLKYYSLSFAYPFRSIVNCIIFCIFPLRGVNNTPQYCWTCNNFPGDFLPGKR